MQNRKQNIKKMERIYERLERRKIVEDDNSFSLSWILSINRDTHTTILNNTLNAVVDSYRLNKAIGKTHEVCEGCENGK